MSILISLGLLYVPLSIRKKRLNELFQTTADAFHCSPPLLEGLTFDERLSLFAGFTRDEAEKAIAKGNESEIKKRLYEGAFSLAIELKTTFHANTRKDIMKLARLIYKILKIDFKSKQNGAIVIKQCFFSHYYSSRVCMVISSLDEGLLEGLSGGEFKFLQRITEGRSCCKALLTFNGSFD